VKTVFVDGESGTTGLEITSRLEPREDIRLLSLPVERRRDRSARRDFLNQADLAILCLPDDAARDAVALVENDRTKIVDASTAHRTASGWIYGIPEIHGQRELLSRAMRISNPGCYPTGFVLLLSPLTDASIVPTDYPIVTYAITGYYAGERFVQVMPLNYDASLVDGFLCPQGCNDTNRVELFVYENEGCALLIARLDNLGKGASGAAVQNMNIALGLGEREGLQ